MSVWDEIGSQAGVNIYAGLSPEEALNKWYRIRNEVAARYGYTPEQLRQGGINVQAMAPQDRMAFSMDMLAQQNPEAFRLVATGKDRVKQEGTDTRKVFNTQTGEWDTKDVKGWWSHPESWGQLALGGLFGAAAPAAIASGGSSAVAPASGGLSLGAVEGGAYGLPASSAAMLPGATAVPAAAGGAAAGAGTLGTLGKLAPYLIGAGTDLLGGYMGSKASKDAAKQQLAYGEKAMDAMRNAYGQELGFYGQQRDVYAPYNQIGQSALGNLAGLAGLPAPAAPRSNPTMIRLRAPDGSVQAVPESDVQHYIQRGAQIA